jgi:hypothetical protein
MSGKVCHFAGRLMSLAFPNNPPENPPLRDGREVDEAVRPPQPIYFKQRK